MNMTTIKRDKPSPCKGCPDKKVGCHRSCYKFIKWEVHHQECMEAIRADKNKDKDANGFLTMQHRKYKKVLDRIPKKGGYRG